MISLKRSNQLFSFFKYSSGNRCRQEVVLVSSSRVMKEVVILSWLLCLFQALLCCYELFGRSSRDHHHRTQIPGTEAPLHRHSNRRKAFLLHPPGSRGLLQVRQYGSFELKHLRPNTTVARFIHVISLLVRMPSPKASTVFRFPEEYHGLIDSFTVAAVCFSSTSARYRFFRSVRRSSQKKISTRTCWTSTRWKTEPTTSSTSRCNPCRCSTSTKVRVATLLNRWPYAR